MLIENCKIENRRGMFLVGREAAAYFYGGVVGVGDIRKGK